MQVSSSDMYLGIFNPGCLCYLISLVQMLFHCETFKRKFLTSFRMQDQDENSQTLDSNDLARLLRFLFSQLDCSYSSSTEDEDDPDILPLFHFMQKALAQSTNDVEDYDEDEILVMKDVFETFSHLAKLLKGIPFDPVGVFRGMMQHNILKIELESAGESADDSRIILNNESFLYLSLDSAAETLENSLAIFTSPSVPFSMRWRDPTTKQLTDSPVPVKKLTQILETPEALILQIRRFGYDKEKRKRIKKHNRFSFPQIFEMSPYITNFSVSGNQCEGESGRTYFLRAVIVHAGKGAERGHYYAICRVCSSMEQSESDDGDATGGTIPEPELDSHASADEWLLFDDHIVEPYDPKNFEQIFGSGDCLDDDSDSDEDEDPEESSRAFSTAVMLLYEIEL